MGGWREAGEGHRGQRVSLALSTDLEVYQPLLGKLETSQDVWEVVPSQALSL